MTNKRYFPLFSRVSTSYILRILECFEEVRYGS